MAGVGVFAASSHTRDDKTAIELFLAGLHAWGKGLIALVGDRSHLRNGGYVA